MADLSDLAPLDRALGALARHDHPLAPLTTYRVGGPARRYVQVDDERTLARVIDAVRLTQVAVLVVGKGSNLLVADRGFDGLAIQLGGSFAAVEVTGTRIRAGGAASMPVVARRSAAAGLTGFEWAVGVPGSVGGAVRMNAGGHGSDMAASVSRVRVVDLRAGEDGEMTPGDLALGYRCSAIRADQVVVGVELQLAEGDAAAAEAELTEIVRWRRANQPGGHNAGSVFTNPAGDSAGRLIEAAGCKGLRIGTAEVSTKHANFIQSDDGGSADDVRDLMVEVARQVLEATGTALHAETHMVGFEP